MYRNIVNRINTPVLALDVKYFNDRNYYDNKICDMVYDYIYVEIKNNLETIIKEEIIIKYQNKFVKELEIKQKMAMDKVNTIINDYKELYCTKIKNSLNDKYRNMDMNNVFEILQDLTDNHLQQENNLNNKINKIKEKLKDINNNNDKICQLENRLLVVEKDNKELLFQNKKVKNKYMQINNIYKKLQNNCFTKNRSIKKKKNKNKIDSKGKEFSRKILSTLQAKKNEN